MEADPAFAVRLACCLSCGIAAGLLVHAFYRGKPFFDFTGFEPRPGRDTDPNPLLRFLQNLGRNLKATGPRFLVGVLLSALFQRYVQADGFADACAALRYAWDNAAALGIDRMRLAVGGDSAGGALAAGCAQWARDCAGIGLCFQLLLYPVTDCRMQTDSMRRGRDTPLWNARLNRRMWRLYLRGGAGDHPSWAAPMLAERFDGLPPAYVEVEQFDCLHDEGIAYAAALQAAGVSVQVEDVRGTFHGFDVFRKADLVKKQIEARSRALRTAFEKGA